MLISCTDFKSTELGHFETIIVGSGAVGLMTAVDLARSGHRILVLEAGLTVVDQSSQKFFADARSIGHQLRGLHTGRFRALGGSTNFWGGQLVPIDPIVFRGRNWLPDHPGWLVSREELEPYYSRVLLLAGMEGVIAHDADVIARLRLQRLSLTTSLKYFFTRWIPQPNFARLFSEDLKSLPNLVVVTGAPVVSLVGNAGTARLRGVEIVGPNGERSQFLGDRILLQNGTIEIARLLLLPLADGSTAPWRSNPWIGKGFTDHLDCVAGEVELLDKRRFHDLFENAIIGGLKYQPKIMLSESEQVRNKTLNACCQFVFNSSMGEHLANAKIFLRAFRSGEFQKSKKWSQMVRAGVSVGLPMLRRYLQSQRIYSLADRGIAVRVTTEQIVLKQSGIKLATERDALGVPLVELDWRIHGGEMDTIRHLMKLISASFAQDQLANITIDSRLGRQDEALEDLIEDTNHHMGMARMGQNALEGVVDRNLRVFGCPNLYIAGAAVFPSVGFANPTFTAMALGLRLAAAIREGRA